jgi:hypothetical protein
LYGHSPDNNKYTAGKEYRLPRMSERLFLGVCILKFCAIVPVIGDFAMLGNLVISIIMIVQIDTCFNAPVAVKKTTVRFPCRNRPDGISDL